MQSVEASPASKVTGEHLGLGIAFTLLGGVGWGFSGTCAQFLFTNYDVEPTWLVAARMVIAALMFAPLVLGTHRREEVELIRDKPNILITLVFAVFGLFACSSSYLMSIQASDAGTATVLQSLNLLLILVVSCVQMHRLPKRKEAIGVVLALVGTFLIATQGSFTSLSISAAALFWGICNAVACALYTLLPAKPLARHGSVAVTGTAICIAAVVACVVYQPWSHMPTLDLVGGNRHVRVVFALRHRRQDRRQPSGGSACEHRAHRGVRAVRRVDGHRLLWVRSGGNGSYHHHDVPDGIKSGCTSLSVR